ncbi:MAG TPA: hypothetical protein VEL73_09230 [Mycobacteriales bacterium]|nr:hypothetical protein [Mycobacteriales bacterium]
MVCFAAVSAYVQVPILFLRTSPREAKLLAGSPAVSPVLDGLAEPVRERSAAGPLRA